MEPERYYLEPALAYARDRLPAHASSDDATLWSAARDAELPLHRFKRKAGLPRVERVLSVLEGLRPQRLLDVGSGRGAFLWPLLDRFPDLDVTCVDVLEHRVRDIEHVRRGGVSRLRAILGDVGSVAVPGAPYDVVTILEVLEHLHDPLPAARAVVAASSGFVVASVPSRPDDNPEHVRLFTADSLTDLLREAGAEKVRVDFVRGHMIAVAR